MKTLAPCLVTIAGLMGTSALSADMAVKAPPPAVAPAPAFSWTGFYLGAALGAEWADTAWTTTSLVSPPFSPVIDSSSPLNYDLSGFRYGGYIGYNWRIAPQWVWGVEADLADANKTVTAAGIPGCSIVCIGGFPGPVADASWVKMLWDASLRARVGYLVSPVLLTYVTGGIAWQKVEASATCQHSVADPLCVVVAGNPFGTGTGSAILTGWSIGGGFEDRIYGNWFLRGEYRYSNFGTWTGNVLDLSVPGSPASVGHSLKVASQIATGGFTYHFGL